MSILAVQPSLTAPAPDAAAATRLSPLAEVIGADLTVPLVHGAATRYVNLDYAASAPPPPGAPRGPGPPRAAPPRPTGPAGPGMGGSVAARDDAVVISPRNT